MGFLGFLFSVCAFGIYAKRIGELNSLHDHIMQVVKLPSSVVQAMERYERNSHKEKASCSSLDHCHNP